MLRLSVRVERAYLPWWSEGLHGSSIHPAAPRSRQCICHVVRAAACLHAAALSLGSTQQAGGPTCCLAPGGASSSCKAWLPA